MDDPPNKEVAGLVPPKRELEGVVPKPPVVCVWPNVDGAVVVVLKGEFVAPPKPVDVFCWEVKPDPLKAGLPKAPA